MMILLGPKRGAGYFSKIERKKKRIAHLVGCWKVLNFKHHASYI